MPAGKQSTFIPFLSEKTLAKKRYESRSISERSGKASPLGELINRLIDTYKLRDSFDEARLVAAWRKVAGETVARRTVRLFVKNRKLFIELESAPLKYDMQMQAGLICERLNKEVGRKLIDSVIFL